MIFTFLFAFLSFFCFVLGTNDYGFSLLKLSFQNVNWDTYEPTTCRNMAYYFSTVFFYLSFSSYRYEYLKKKSVSKNFVHIYTKIKLIVFKKIENHSFKLSFHKLSLVLIIIFGLLARAYKMPFVILYDEAATYLDYCDGGFTSFLKIWNVNNHLINTLLMKISIEVFGNGVVALRLPSFMFGVANHVLIYYISKKLYEKKVALFSTFIYSCTPFLIHFESQARGYSIKVTFTLLLFIACFHFLQKPNKTYVVLISLVSSLGFLTIFSFILPFFGFLIWIGYGLFKQKIFENILIANYIFLIIIYTKFITVFFYTPSIILSNGISSILKVSRAGNVDVYGSFPDDIPTFFVNLINMLFFNNTLLAVIVFCILIYTILKEDRLKSLMLSHVASAIIINVAVSAIFPSRIFIYTIPFIIISMAVFISKLSFPIKRIYSLFLPIFQLLICVYFFQNNIFEKYHDGMNNDVINIAKKLKTLVDNPLKSKILLSVNTGFYKSFKYYQRIYNLPKVEMYAGKHNSKNKHLVNIDTYIVSFKNNIKKDDSFTKVFEGEVFEIYKSKSL